MNTIVNLEAKKVELIAHIARLADYSLLLKIETILKLSEEHSEEWEDISESDKLKIEKSLESIQNGNTVSHSVAMNRINQFIDKL